MLKSWSWTALTNWRKCPRKYFHTAVIRDVVEEESEAMSSGKAVHKLMEKRVKIGEPLPLIYHRYDKWAVEIDTLRKDGATILVEQKLAFDRDFRASPWSDSATWFRGVVDVVALMRKYDVAAAYDWKTGKIEDNHQQLALHAQLVLLHYPEIKQVSTNYIWLKHGARGGPKVYGQKELTGVWNVLWPELKMFERMHETMEFPPKPSGLCIRHCPVKGCPYHGVGS